MGRILEVDDRGEDAVRDRVVAQFFLEQLDLFVNLDAALLGNLHGLPLALSSGSPSGILSSIVCCYGQVAGDHGITASGVGLDMLDFEFAVDISFHGVIGGVFLLARSIEGTMIRHCEDVCGQL